MRCAVSWAAAGVHKWSFLVSSQSWWCELKSPNSNTWSLGVGRMFQISCSIYLAMAGITSRFLLSSYILKIVSFPNVPLSWMTVTSEDGNGSCLQLLALMRLLMRVTARDLS